MMYFFSLSFAESLVSSRYATIFSRLPIMYSKAQPINSSFDPK